MPTTRKDEITADWQEHLDFLLPRTEFLRPDQVARALNINPRTVDHLFAPDGRKVCPDLCGFEFVGRGTGERPHKRILRDSALLLVAEGANYTPTELRARIVEILTKRSVPELLIIQQALSTLIRKKQS